MSLLKLLGLSTPGPRCRKPAAKRRLVVVFPQDPVTAVENPDHAARCAAARCPRATLVSGTTNCGQECWAAWATTTALAPRETAWSTWSWASNRSPFRAKNHWSGLISRVSVDKEKNGGAAPIQEPPVTSAANAPFNTSTPFLRTIAKRFGDMASVVKRDPVCP